MKDWICRNCGQEVLADERPSFKWTDGHVCSFREVKERHSQKERIPMTPEEIEDKAQEIANWLNGAYMDAAMNQVLVDTGEENYIKAEGIADRMTADVDIICDLTGDRIHDEAKGSWSNMILIAEEMKNCGVMKEAMDSHINRWKDYLIERSEQGDKYR